MLTDHSGFKVHKNSSRDMLSSSSLTEKSVEGIISSADGLVTGHLSVWLNAMFQAVKLPAGIPNLDASLSNVDGDAFTLWGKNKNNMSIRCTPFSFRSEWRDTNWKILIVYLGTMPITPCFWAKQSLKSIPITSILVFTWLLSPYMVLLCNKSFLP